MSTNTHYMIASAFAGLLSRYKPVIIWHRPSGSYMLTAFKSKFSCSLFIHSDRIEFAPNEPNEHTYWRKPRALLLAKQDTPCKVNKLIREDFVLQKKYWTRVSVGQSLIKPPSYSGVKSWQSKKI